MTALLTQFTITEISTGYWRVTFSNPPINLADPDTIIELQQLVGLIESDDTLRVVVLDSAHPDFFINRYDVARVAETPVEPGPTGLPAFIDTTTRLTNSPVVTIASIRGRTRGGGAELAAACDMRFASLERAIFGQPEVGAGLLPGGGAIERLPLLVGRARALEIILGSDDFDAATAAAYGWINRALPDDELDEFVDTLARRIASFDKAAIAAAKNLVNQVSLPSADRLLEALNSFQAALAWTETQQRIEALLKRGLQQDSDFERRWPEVLDTLVEPGRNT